MKLNNNKFTSHNRVASLLALFLTRYRHWYSIEEIQSCLPASKSKRSIDSRMEALMDIGIKFETMSYPNGSIMYRLKTNKNLALLVYFRINIKKPKTKK